MESTVLNSETIEAGILSTYKYEYAWMLEAEM